MARFKVLKGVAHNVGHSFTSSMNQAGDDYVMGHILRLARRTGLNTLTVDLVDGKAAPLELLDESARDVPSRYSKVFWDMVERQGSDKSYVQSASLVVRYDTSIQRVWSGDRQFLESPFVCDVRVVDARGKEHTAHFEGWWFPERLDYQRQDLVPWWRKWFRFRFK